MNTEKLRKIAARWLESQRPALPAGGVVLIFDATVYGWKHELRDPQHERPGVIAVEDDGRLWIAEGGNDYDGAARWQELHETR